MNRIAAIVTLLAASVGISAADLTTAPAPQQEWGLVTVGCASLRSEPRHGAELETQAVTGTPVLLDTARCGEWRMVRMPDGYRAWMHTSAFVAVDSASIAGWRHSPRLVVTDPYGGVVTSDTVSSRGSSAVTDVALGAVLDGTLDFGSAYARVALPDGRKGYLPAGSVEPFDRWCARRADVERIISTARSMTGVTYLWGGTTPKAVDCSGFTQVCFRAAGILLPRNASAQALTGTPIPADRPEEWRRGDLLFFGPDPDTTRITHVGIYLGANRYIHSSGMVMTSSTDHDDELYLPRKVLAVRRIDLGSNKQEHHGWYF